MQAKRERLAAGSAGQAIFAYTKLMVHKPDAEAGPRPISNQLRESSRNNAEGLPRPQQAGGRLSTRGSRHIELSKYVDRESAIFELCQGRRVLHLGCVGFTDLDPGQRVAMARQSLHWTLSQIADVVGIDSAEKVVREYERLGIFSNILVGDVTRLAALRLRADFDVILAGDILEHVSNPGSMLDGLRTLCHSQTRLVLTTPHAFGLPNYLRFVAGRFFEGEEHVMTFNLQNLQHLFTRHGFKIETAQTCYQGQARRSKLLFGIGSAFLRRFPKFGGTLFVVAVPTEIRK